MRYEEAPSRRLLAMLVAFGLWGAASARADDIKGKVQSSIDVGDVAKDGGQQMIVINFPGKGKGVYKLTLNIPAGATPQAVAQTIIQKVNENYPGEASLAPDSKTEIDLKFGRLDSQVGNAVDLQRDTSVISMAPVPKGDAVAILSFDPNGNGQTTLATDMDITASFSGGSPSDSFVAPAGDTLAQLTSLVNTNLGASGFATRQLDATDIELYTPSLEPASFQVFFDMTPTGPIGNNGIDVALTAVVPEPGAWALLLTGFGALGAVLRARRRPVGALAQANNGSST